MSSKHRPKKLRLSKTALANLGGTAGGTITPLATVVEVTVEVGSAVTRNTGRIARSAMRSAKATEHMDSNPSDKNSNSCGFTGGCPVYATNSK